MRWASLAPGWLAPPSFVFCGVFGRPKVGGGTDLATWLAGIFSLPTLAACVMHPRGFPGDSPSKGPNKKAAFVGSNLLLVVAVS